MPERGWSLFSSPPEARRPWQNRLQVCRRWRVAPFPRLSLWNGFRRKLEQLFCLSCRGYVVYVSLGRAIIGEWKWLIHRISYSLRRHETPWANPNDCAFYVWNKGRKGCHDQGRGDHCARCHASRFERVWNDAQWDRRACCRETKEDVFLEVRTSFYVENASETYRLTPAQQFKNMFTKNKV